MTNTSAFLKKGLVFILFLSILFSTAACSNGAKPDASSAQEVLDITLDVPGFVVDGVTLKTNLTKDQPGLVSTKDEAKDRYTIQMSSTMYSKVLEEYKAAVQEALNSFKGGETFSSITDISYDETFSTVTVKADKATFENSPDALSVMAIGLVASSYQYFTGTDEDKVQVRVEIQDNSTGDTILSSDYPESLRAK